MANAVRPVGPERVHVRRGLVQEFPVGCGASWAGRTLLWSFKAAGMMLLPRRRQSEVPDVPAGGATAGARVGNLPGSLDPFDPTRLT